MHISQSQDIFQKNRDIILNLNSFLRINESLSDIINLFLDNDRRIMIIGGFVRFLTGEVLSYKDIDLLVEYEEDLELLMNFIKNFKINSLKGIKFDYKNEKYDCFILKNHVNLKRKRIFIPFKEYPKHVFFTIDCIGVEISREGYIIHSDPLFYKDFYDKLLNIQNDYCVNKLTLRKNLRKALEKQNQGYILSKDIVKLLKENNL